MTLERRRVLLAVLVVVAVGVVALAARSDHGERGAAALRPSPQSVGTGKAMLIIAVVLALVVIVGMVLWGMRPDGWSGLEVRERSWLRTVGGIVFVLVLIAALAQLRRNDEDAPHRDRVVSPGGVIDPSGRGADGGGTTSPEWGYGLVGIALLLAAIGAVAYARRVTPAVVGLRGAAPVATVDEQALAVAAAEACTDPRQAVLLAFAAAEALLSPDPTTRRPPATSAREWAAAVGSTPLTTIVGRYEIARFSQHTVSDDDRRIAVDAMRSLA